MRVHKLMIFCTQEMTENAQNFVLLDGHILTYSSNRKWVDREQTLWKSLHKTKPLNERSKRRSNIPCVQSLKVIIGTVC